MLLDHIKIDSALKYLGVELEDALAIAEPVEIGSGWGELKKRTSR